MGTSTTEIIDAGKEINSNDDIIHDTDDFHWAGEPDDLHFTNGTAS